MPPLPLTSALLRSLSWLSVRGRAAVQLLVCDNGRLTSAAALAAALGLRNRFQLARFLRQEGLPPYDVLTGWISLLYWRLEAERAHGTLVALAPRSHLAPATSYRLVRRITGARWSELRNASPDELLRHLVEQCRPDQRLPQPTGPAAAPIWTALPAPGVPHQRDARAVIRLPLDHVPFSVAPLASGEVYVSQARAASLQRLDVAAKRFLGGIPVGCVPSAIAVDTRRACVYTSLQYEDAIAVIDTDEHRVVRHMAVSGNPFPVLLASAGDRLYTCTNEDRLYCLALPTGRIIASLALPATSHSLALHPSGRRLYVATRSAGTVLEVDVATCRVQRTFAVGGEANEIRVTADGCFVFVANGHHGLNVVRLADGRLLRTLAFGGRPVHLALSPNEDTIYVSQVENAAVAVIDRATSRMSFLRTGGRPRGMAMSSRHGALIIANESGWVDLIPHLWQRPSASNQTIEVNSLL